MDVKLRSAVARLMYRVVAKCHDEWREVRGFSLNNLIIDMLRNRLSHDVHEWLQVYIKKRHVHVPEKLRCPREVLADLSYRRFKGLFEARPCEICGSSRALNVAHIIPKAVGGPDDDCNLVHLYANHHYLFDRGLLTREEYASIRWSEKGTEARYYADMVRVPQHEVNWVNEV